MTRRRRRIMYIILSVVLIIFLAIVVFVNQPSFGRTPRGERLERIRNSPNYRDGKFQNLSPTDRLTSEKSSVRTMLDFLFGDVENLRPSVNLPTVKTELKKLNKDEDLIVWLGHSSLFIQLDGKRFLIDPTLVNASPVSFINKPFLGTAIYKPDDMPDIDYLVITHDHYDHLDYKTVKGLKARIGRVICPLGVGEHFEYWGFDADRIMELDWMEKIVLDSSSTIHCLPARHFSGRSLWADKSLWASFMLQTPSRNIYISGDGGYDTHFADIGRQFAPIDLAILENGQYNADWKFIHMMPENLINAAKDLNAKRLMTMHNSKYALSKHAWSEPLDNVSKVAQSDSLSLLTPMIGEVVRLDDSTQVFGNWWSDVELASQKHILP